jgi:hypothetical protein
MGMTVRDVKDKAPNEDTIKMLEAVLEAAKAGEIRTVVMVAGWNDDSWTHHYSIDHRNNRRRLIGETTMLHFDMMTNQALDDETSVLAGIFW